MRIGIDARELGGHVTGVGRILGSLLREWSNSSLARAHEFVLYAPEPLEGLGARVARGSDVRLPRVGPAPGAPPGIADSRQFHTREVAGAPGTWWEQMRLPKAMAGDGLDVFFAPAYTAPLRTRVPFVVFIHDVSYVVHPEWFSLRDGIRRRWLTELTAGKAQSIVTPSQFSRSEVIEHLRVPEQLVHVVVPGIDRPASAQPGPASSPAGASAHGEARVLYVGSILNRRHVPDLIRAVSMLAHSRPDVSLDIVGDDRTFPPEDLGAAIAHPGLDGRVRWHRYVTDAQLLELYGRARAFAFLSEYEGLGMTPLEALAAGVPPVVYDTAVARESYADAALYVRVGDPAGVVQALERALFDEQTRSAVLAAAPTTLARYEWPRAAREMLTVIENAAKSG
jgi:glycosyltransferase involved in cell wall biosynthesis